VWRPARVAPASAGRVRCLSTRCGPALSAAAPPRHRS